MTYNKNGDVRTNINRVECRDTDKGNPTMGVTFVLI